MDKKLPGDRSISVPAYLEDVAAVTSDLEPGTVNHVAVKHDATCDLLTRGGQCTCKPDVALLKPS
jgi:hypothetical protein